MMRVTLVLFTAFTVVNGNCQLMNNNNHSEAILATMQKWKVYGKRFVIHNDDIEYSIGICTTATSQMNNTVAVRQQQNQIEYFLGHFDQSNLVQGAGWIMLQYQNGDRYQKGDDCDEDRRVASIIFICGSNSSTLTVVEDSSKSDQTCNYLFEMQIPEMCSTQENKAKLGGGAIFLIVLFSLAGSYLLVGFLFMHFVRGARGLERIPNLTLWQNFGRLAAEGWAFCFRRCERNPLNVGYSWEEAEVHEGEDDELLAT